VQVTPLQALREAATIASKGIVVTPHLWMNAATSTAYIDIPETYFSVVHEGMRRVATVGTAQLNIPNVKFAAKSGTAELGVSKSRVNSWVIGFFPYENPRYAFAIVMERGVKGNTMNATYVARQFFMWMGSSTPEYFKVSE
jgi:cell division protein FtsI/penicillin-binding protein 2